MKPTDLSSIREADDRPAVIIGIHGLANKPPEDEKKNWWRAAIEEGLRRNSGLDVPLANFEFVYWADLRYDGPLTPDDNLEPYYPDDSKGPFPHHNPKDESLWLKFSHAVGTTIGKIETAINSNIVDEVVLEYQFDDLWLYQENNEFAKDARSRLWDKLQKYKDHRVVLVAHSMGSVIAYDCLRLAERRGDSVQIAHLVTIGSPLGLNAIVDKISEEHAVARVPSAVAEWTNLYDRGDLVAVAAPLSESFAPNERGVCVRDRIVENAYRRPRGEENRHKSYGYLRTPEFSEIVCGFLDEAGSPAARREDPEIELRT